MKTEKQDRSNYKIQLYAGPRKLWEGKRIRQEFFYDVGVACDNWLKKHGIIADWHEKDFLL